MKRMKRMKKFVSFLLTAIMVFAMAAPVFADEGDKTLTITDAKDDHTYTAYQIFKGEVSGNENSFTLSNIEWGDDVNFNGLVEALKNSEKDEIKNAFGKIGDEELTAPYNAVAVAERINLLRTGSTQEMSIGVADEFAKIVALYTVGSGTELDKNGEIASSDVKPGYYIIKDVSNVAATVEGDTVSRFMVQVVGDTTVAQKSSTTSVEKNIRKIQKVYDPQIDKVITDEDEVKLEEAGIGEERTFTLEATLPDDYSLFKSFYLKFDDTMQNMEFVRIDAVEVIRVADGSSTRIATVAAAPENSNVDTENFDKYHVSLPDPETNDKGYITSTVLGVTIKDLKRVHNNIQAGDKVVVTYKAKLTPAAVVSSNTNENAVTLTYSKDPNSLWTPGNPNDPVPPTGITPESTVELVTTELVISKTDGSKALSGAEFTLTGDTNDVLIKASQVFSVDSNGTYYKLIDGTYTTTDPTGENVDTSNYEDPTGTTKYIKSDAVEIVRTNPKEGSPTVKGFVGEDGKLTFTGLGEGSYTLKESVTPTGYNTIGDIKFDVTFIEETELFEVEVTEGDAVIIAHPADGEGADVVNNLTTTIVNKRGSVLPETGGIGTTIFYVLGSILALGAGIVLITRRRMKAEQ